jgi:tetratricopeptide (TPR) repeat protein
LAGTAAAATPDGIAGAGTPAGVADFVEGFLHYQTRITNVIPAADTDPTHVLLNVYAGFLLLLSESPSGALRASRYLLRARHAEASSSMAFDVQLTVGLLSAWVDDDVPAALSIAERILEANPCDLVILKLHQYLNCNLGRSAELLRIALQVEPHNRGNAQFYGMLAFAYEQCHLLSEAEAAARLAIALRSDEPWAQHALAHVMLTEGRIEEGVMLLESARNGWSRLNSFMRTHLWWHLCLFYLSQGREQEILALYDTQVWGVDKDYSQDQVGAVSLLARLELAGVDVGERWSDLGDHLASRAKDTVLPFLSLQYLYGLGRAGRGEAELLLASIVRRGEVAPAYSHSIWSEITAPAAEGLLAHARHGDPKITIARLGQALPGIIAIGGSHAQRDLFEQIWLDALLQDRRWTVAQHLFEQRRKADPENAPLNRSLASVYQHLDLPIQAQQALRRADATARAFHTVPHS